MDTICNIFPVERRSELVVPPLEHASPATRLLEKRRQIFEVQEALDQHKEDYASKVARCTYSYQA